MKEFNQALDELEARYQREKREILAERNSWIASMWPKFKLGHYVVAENEWLQWKCEKSPIDICIYNDIEDPIHDFCIFCKQPEERQ